MSKPLVQRYNGLENLKGRSKTNMTSMLLSEKNDENRESIITFENIPLDKITPRSINQYSQTRIERLARSIRKTGNRLINPITLVRAADLPQDGDIIQRFKENGVDVSSLEYIIVAGERRYRAFRLLQEEENEKDYDIGTYNPFDTITANVLSADEAKNEHIFYEDSNTESRQLGPEEIMRLFDAALSEIDSDEKKVKMLREMSAAGVAFSKEIPEKESEAVKLFRADKYCLYYLEKELGIGGWKEATVRRYISILNSCCDEVKEAIYDCRFTLNLARDLCSLSYEEQRKLLGLWLDGKPDAYNALLESYKTVPVRKDKKHNERTASKCLSKSYGMFLSCLEELAIEEKNLSGENRKKIKRAIDLLSSVAEEYKTIAEEISSSKRK